MRKGRIRYFPKVDCQLESGCDFHKPYR
jgi:hypothetical protein